MRPNLARRSTLPIVLFTLVGAGSAAGQSVPNRPSWGTSDKIFHPVLHFEFSPTSSSSSWINDIDGLYPTAGSGIFLAALRLPTGALLTDLELDYNDTDLTEFVALGLVRCDVFLIDCSTLGGLLNSNSGPGGRSFVVLNLEGFNITVDNGSQKLFLQTVMTGGETTRLLGAYVVYKLQVSPAPGTATFADVPTGHPQFQFIEALVAAGITAGCGSGNYCPDATLTRGQMAVFLAKALGLHFPN